ncbi:efflux RND transporter periplasmic adaptor subunit [Paenibacillus sp. P96]|uniref:Efflux RND transporter periplasmic adaptor subunit n=1 Tax=Paenibacillus zeirhizosphaerae TaxID=2987519 RepID=A0ABT9FVY0_9BACL|nr:efflux RND transporter periplasmic adaptor subunit [Paenibacillus sp. P96]MDP4098814.1 efflux RND transporter periplasmic adaptor subunit [Paenibacillus sp. P96]
MNKKSFTIISALVLAATLAGCSGGEAPAAAPVEQAAASVEIGQVKRGSIADEAGITGTLAPNKSVQIASKINGTIASINLRIGQNINKGDVLFTLDQKDIQDNITQAQESYNVALANLKQAQSSAEQSVQQAESGVDQAKSALVQQQSAIEQAQTSATDAESSLRDAQNSLNRTQQLFAAGVVSQTELEQAQATARQAQSALDHARLTLRNAQSSLESAQTTYNNAVKSLRLARNGSGVDVSRASVNQARSNLQTVRSQLADATVKAPLSGTLAAVNGTAGQLVSSQTSVVTIANTNPILVKINLAESEMMNVKIGSPITVEIPSLEKKINAKVTAISSVMDEEIRAYPVEISVDNPSNTLKAGMVANVYTQSGDAEELLIPQAAVTEKAGTKHVYIVEANVAKQVEITTGEESANQVEVTEGLSEGQQIVVKGATMLTDGAQVSIVNH